MMFWDIAWDLGIAILAALGAKAIIWLAGRYVCAG